MWFGLLLVALHLRVQDLCLIQLFPFLGRTLLKFQTKAQSLFLEEKKEKKSMAIYIFCYK